MKDISGNRWFLLALLSVTWGSSFILIKKSLLAFTPLQIGAFRIGISGLLLAVIGIRAIRKMSVPTLVWATIVGFFGNFFPMFLFPLAQTRISSSLAGILDSLVPVFVLVLGFIIFGIRSQRIQVLGTLLGFSGALILLYYSDPDHVESHWGYASLVILATACYAMSALLIKRKLDHVPSLHLSSAVFTIWLLPSLFILLGSGFLSEFQNHPETLEALGYLSILTLAGTTAAIVLYYKLIRDTSPIFASSVTYLLPIVSVVWGLIDGEKITIWYLLGGILILSGIYLIQEKNQPD